MKRAIFYIKDKQLYHLGNTYGIQDYYPSDKLFSALVNFASMLYEKEEFDIVLNKLKNVQISSMFLGIEILDLENKNSKKIFFNQKPMYKTGKSKEITDEELTTLKKVKKITYVSDRVLKNLLKSFDKNENKFIYDLSENIIIQDKFALDKDDIKISNERLKDKKIIRNITTTGMVENRLTGGSGDVFYNDFIEVNYIYANGYVIKPFMYFNIDNYFDEMNGLLNLMCDEGIGGHRSNGTGTFQKFEIIDAGFDFRKNGEYSMNISTIYPQKSEISSFVSYTLDDRNGFIYSNGPTGIKKPYYRVIKDGSIFRGNNVKGEILEIPVQGLNHKIYLYGKAFLIGFGDEKDELKD